ncbi:hypothetical protein [Aestuariimicrobium ganziense]|uniref:hypothetical protein n=1 Tax=Aestuariimicrobium ganziense TaxID=2773677 RepID=UPI001943E666|nr:hypothetical protein [Aestuariimicrobium ganziense]
MGLLVLASATGSPGVTTTALGLTLHWPRDVLLVDADRVPSQALEAGYLSQIPTAGRGLMALAQAHRERRDLAQAAWELAVPLPASAAPQRRYLAGFTHPAGGRPLHADLGADGGRTAQARGAGDRRDRRRRTHRIRPAVAPA